jgi:hypothetical protein
MFIALVCNIKNLGGGCQHPISTTAPTEEVVVGNAIALRARLPCPGHYDIFVGELTHQVAVTPNYKLVKMVV